MFWLLISIAVLFFLAFGLKKIFSNLCAVCFAVFFTWLFGLILFFSNQNFIEIDSSALALLMGGSAVGFMYYLGGVLPEKFLVFRLPYLLTAFTLFYFILNLTFVFSIVVLLIVFWIIFGLVFLFRNQATSKWFKKIIECCRNW